MDPGQSSPKTDAPDVFLEYRLTSMLLALVATLSGHRGATTYEPPLERSQSSRKTLNALANILVRNTEVVAVTAVADSSPHPVKIDLESMVQDRKRVDYEQASSLSGGLFQAISTTFDAQAQRLNPPVVTPPLYARQTFVDFHYLLLVALNGYKTAIRKIHNSTERKSEECLELEIYTHLLWRLANSSILKTHLSFMQKLSLIFESFIRYLLSTCYPKIHRRLFNEFSTNLFQVLEDFCVRESW
jgi:hypothetical protein